MEFQISQIDITVRKLAEMTESNEAKWNEEVVALGAIAIHSFYNGVESCIRLLLNSRGVALPSGGSWHSALLDLASDLPAAGQPLLTKETTSMLRPLLAFRHFFRHVY